MSKYVRRDITTLSADELERFTTAFAALAASPDFALLAAAHGGGFPAADVVDSNIATLAALDGGAADADHRNKVFCAHGSHRFAIWHRPFVAEFERALQRHDPQQRGHAAPDALALPYWHWDSGWQTVPAVLTEVPLDRGTARPSAAEARRGAGGARATTRRVRGSRSAERALQRFMAQRSYYAAVAGGGGAAASLEAPHGQQHVAVGGDMARVLTAAFDPIFWLHHNNVERQHHSWVSAHGTDWRQVGVLERDAHAPLWPFAPRAKFDGDGVHFWQHDGGDGAATLAEWFDNDSLPYTYDNLLPAPSDETPLLPASLPPGAALRAAPHVERVVRVYDVATPPRACFLHVWLGTPRSPLPDELAIDGAGYVGAEYFFVVNGDDDIACVGCARRGAAVTTIAASELLRSIQWRDGDETHIEVRWQPIDDENDVLLAVEYSGASVARESEPVKQHDGDNSLQVDGSDRWRVLRFFVENGWLTPDDAVAQANDDKTLHSLATKVQKCFESKARFGDLVADGVWGPQSRKLLREPRCGVASASSKLTRTALLGALAASGTRRIAVVVREALDAPADDEVASAEAAAAAIVAAGALWSTALARVGGPDVTFVSGDAGSDANVLHVHFTNLDGAGDVLAWTGDKDGVTTLYFDSWHRWTPQYLQRVAAHELGHALGLPHDTEDAASIMFPFKSTEEPLVRDDDARAVAQAIGGGDGAAPAGSSKPDDDGDDQGDGDGGQTSAPAQAPQFGDATLRRAAVSKAQPAPPSKPAAAAEKPTTQITDATATPSTTDSANAQLSRKLSLLPEAGMRFVKIVVCEARGLHGADLGGTSDPFVKIDIKSAAGESERVGKTTVRKRTRDPKWNEEFDGVLDFATFKTLSFAVHDHNMLGHSTPIGKCELTSEQLFEGESWLDVTPQTNEKASGQLLIKLFWK